MTSMYQVKPLFNLTCLNIHTNMYAMKNIHEASQISNDAVRHGIDDKDVGCMNFIEDRQLEILKRLKELRELLAAPIASQVPSTKIDTTPTSIVKMRSQTVDLSKCGLAQDIVLNINPSHLPYSLLGITKLWKDLFDVRITCHTHSTVRSLPKNALEFQEKLLSLSRDSSYGKSAELAIRLVWKEVEQGDCVVVISPIKSVAVFGEINFLRLLNDCVSQSTTSTTTQRTILDDKLDSCHSLSVDPNKSNVQCHVQNLFSALNSNENKWLLSSEPSVVDLAAWSVVSRQSKSIPLDAAGKRWFQNCINFFSS